MSSPYRNQRQLRYLGGIRSQTDADTQIPNAADGVGYNLYAYMANSPRRWADPSEHQIPGAMAMTPQLSEFGYLMMSIGLAGLEVMRGAAGLFGGSMTLGAATFLTGFVLAVLAMLCLAAKDGPCYTASRVVANALEGINFCASSFDSSGHAYETQVLTAYLTGDYDMLTPENCIPKPREEEEKEECKADVPYLVRTARLYKALVRPNMDAYARQNYAVLRYKSKWFGCVDMVAANGLTTMNESQKLLRLTLGQSYAEPLRSRLHAEKTVIERARGTFDWVAHVALGVSDIICPKCQSYVTSEGGIITPRQNAATWQ